MRVASDLRQATVYERSVRGLKHVPDLSKIGGSNRVCRLLITLARAGPSAPPSF